MMELVVIGVIFGTIIIVKTSQIPLEMKHRKKIRQFCNDDMLYENKNHLECDANNESKLNNSDAALQA